MLALQGADGLHAGGRVLVRGVAASDAGSGVFHQFHRDVKRAQKRGKDMVKRKALLATLIAEQPLAPQYKDHPLKNNWSGYRDAHLEPDWLLIYCIDGNVVRFERTGTHADIFD